MKTETYQELKTRWGKEINAFPMAFAFSNEQLKEVLVNLETTIEEVVSIGSGGIIRKTDLVAYEALFERIGVERVAAFENNVVLIEAIRHELGNHEYIYTSDPTDALNALEITLDDERTATCFKIARAQYLYACEEMEKLFVSKQKVEAND